MKLNIRRPSQYIRYHESNASEEAYNDDILSRTKEEILEEAQPVWNEAFVK